MKQAIKSFDREKSFSNLDVNKQVSGFNETIMTIFEISFHTKQLPVTGKIFPGETDKLEELLWKTRFI